MFRRLSSSSPHQSSNSDHPKSDKNLDVVIVVVLVVAWILLLILLSIENSAKMTRQNENQNVNEEVQGPLVRSSHSIPYYRYTSICQKVDARKQSQWSRSTCKSIYVIYGGASGTCQRV